MTPGQRAYRRYTFDRLRPDGERYPEWVKLTVACRHSWDSLASCADAGGGVVPAQRFYND
jgi:hypothetical protein